MKLHVEPTGITDGLSLGVSAPECGCGRVAVGTREADATGSRQPPLRFEQGPVDAVHLVIEPTGIAEVVPCAISPPQRGGHGPTVDTFSPF